MRWAYDVTLGKWVVLINDVVLYIEDTEEEAVRRAKNN
jgi:hypothetical protein